MNHRPAKWSIVTAWQAKMNRSDVLQSCNYKLGLAALDELWEWQQLLTKTKEMCVCVCEILPSCLLTAKSEGCTWYRWVLARPDVFQTCNPTAQSYFLEHLKVVQSPGRNIVNPHIPMSPQTNGTTIQVSLMTVIIVTFDSLTPTFWRTKPNRPLAWRCWSATS